MEKPKSGTGSMVIWEDASHWGGKKYFTKIWDHTGKLLMQIDGRPTFVDDSFGPLISGGKPCKITLPP